MTVHVPRTNLVTPAAMRRFAGFRDRILLQLEGLTHHDSKNHLRRFTPAS